MNIWMVVYLFAWVCAVVWLFRAALIMATPPLDSPVNRTCPACHGAGKQTRPLTLEGGDVQLIETCHECRGTGMLYC